MASSTNRPPQGQSYFETQRTALLQEIGISFEHVLANINKLNRSLEGVIAVGNEFSSVEALWSQFENVMAKDVDVEGVEKEGVGENGGDGEIFEESEVEVGNNRGNSHGRSR